MTFTNIRQYPTTNPPVKWAEMHGEAVVATTARPYQQGYEAFANKDILVRVTVKQVRASL